MSNYLRRLESYFSTCTTASRPTASDSSVRLIDVKDASLDLTCCNTVKFYCSRNDTTNEREVYVNIFEILNVN